MGEKCITHSINTLVGEGEISFPSFHKHRNVISVLMKGRRDTMQVFIRKPSVDLFPGIRVAKDTELEYKNDKVEQKLENLVLHTIIRAKGEGYESFSEITVYLAEGDTLIFEDEGRGYIKPVEQFVTVEEAIEDLTNIKGVGEENVCSE
jgi:hypothetical protein